MGFRKITLPTKTEILLGKDAKSNDELMEEFKGKENKIIHTVAPGSPFCVIDKLNPSAGDITASGAICAGYSQDWRDNKKDVKVNVFTGKDVNKEKGMKVGTWHVAKSKTINIKKKDILKLKNKLFVVCGLPGTGKTTASKEIQKLFGGNILRTDVIAEKLGIDFKDIKKNKEIYNLQKRIYLELIKEAKEILKKGKNAILDATFSKKEFRDLAKALSNQTKSEFILVEIIIPNESLIKKRLKNRNDDASLADFKVYLLYKKKLFEEIKGSHIKIYNSKNLNYLKEQIKSKIR